MTAQRQPDLAPAPPGAASPPLGGESGQIRLQECQFIFFRVSLFYSAPNVKLSPLSGTRSPLSGTRRGLLVALPVLSSLTPPQRQKV